MNTAMHYYSKILLGSLLCLLTSFEFSVQAAVRKTIAQALGDRNILRVKNTTEEDWAVSILGHTYKPVEANKTVELVLPIESIQNDQADFSHVTIENVMDETRLRLQVAAYYNNRTQALRSGAQLTSSDATVLQQHVTSDTVSTQPVNYTVELSLAGDDLELSTFRVF